MADIAANEHPYSQAEPTTIAEIVRGLEPIGDLSRFGIDDLTPDDEAEFFRILEGA